MATITPTDTMSDNASRRRNLVSFLVGGRKETIALKLKDVSSDTRWSERTESIQSDLDSISTIDTTSCLKIRTQEESLAVSYYHHHHHQPHQKSCSVSFSDVEISTHYMILGDNPAAMSGAPLTISWESMETCQISLEEYERTKPIPRGRHEMVVPRNVREAWLFQAGYARIDLVRAVREAQRIRRQREKSMRKQQSYFFSRR